jgi:hypothetical protein
VWAKWNLSYAPETKLLTDGRTDRQTDARGYNIICPFGDIKMVVIGKIIRYLNSYRLQKYLCVNVSVSLICAWYILNLFSERGHADVPITFQMKSNYKLYSFLVCFFVSLTRDIFLFVLTFNWPHILPIYFLQA